MPTPALTAFEQLEAKFIHFVILHSQTFVEAVEYLDMDVSTLRQRRERYGIPTPPPHHYDGPKLSHEEMFAGFRASLAPPAPAAPDLAELARMIKVTFTPPAGPPVTVPLSEVMRAG